MIDRANRQTKQKTGKSTNGSTIEADRQKDIKRHRIFKESHVSDIIDVGQWLASGLQRPSAVRQSLAVRQKKLSEEHRMTLKRQKCIENKQNLCNFPFFLISFSLFSIFPSFFFIFLLFFCFFFLLFSLQVYDRDGLYDKMGLQLKALKARLLRRC